MTTNSNEHSANDNSQLSSEIDALLLSRLKGPMLEFVRTQTHALHTKLAEAQGKLHRTQQELIETKQKLLERERKYRELRNKSLAYRQQVQEWYDVVASTPLSPRPQYNMHHRKSVATAVLSARDITRDRDPRYNDNAVLVQVHGNKEDGSTRTSTSCLSNASTVVVENTTTTTASSSSLSSRASKKRRTHHNTHTTVEEQDGDDDDDIVALVKQEDDSDENNNNNNNNDNNNTMSMIIPAAAVTAAPSSSVSSSNSRINRATKSLAALKARCNIDATEEDVEEEDTNNKECYKYEEVVRKKEDRRQLKGYDCPDCRAFLDAICKDKNGKEHGMFNRSEFVQECSRHRARHVPEDTPPGFWELSFADSVAARGHNDQE